MNGKKNKEEMVTLAQLLDKAHGIGLVGIRTKIEQLPDESNGQTAIHHATVAIQPPGNEPEDVYYFEGTGDASPSNVGNFIKPHIIRMSESRAIVRALRWATNTGKAALEELGEGDAAATPHIAAPPPSSAPTLAQLEDAEIQKKFLHAARPLLAQLLTLDKAAAAAFAKSYPALEDVKATQYRKVVNELRAAVALAQEAAA